MGILWKTKCLRSFVLGTFSSISYINYAIYSAQFLKLKGHKVINQRELLKDKKFSQICNKQLNSLIKNITKMTKQAGLVLGTIIFICLGIVAAIAFHIYVGMKSPAATKSANQRVSLVSVIIAAVSMWIMWACTYMHQMNPLIQPILMVKKG